MFKHRHFPVESILVGSHAIAFVARTMPESPLANIGNDSRTMRKGGDRHSVANAFFGLGKIGRLNRNDFCGPSSRFVLAKRGGEQTLIASFHLVAASS